MVKTKLYRKVPAITICLIITIIICGCTDRISYNDNRNVQIKVSSALGAVSESYVLTTFLLTVTAPEFARPITAELTMVGQYIVGEVLVPAGRARTFVITVYDEFGNLVFQGETTADVTVDGNVEIIIKLYPQVPMIRLAPTATTAPQTFQYIIDVKAYNINNMSAVEFMVSPDVLYSVGLISFEVGESIVDVASITQLDLEDFGFLVNSRNPGQAIVDDTGYVHLARLKLTTYQGDFQFLETNLTVKPLYIWDINQDSIPVSEVQNTGSRIVFYSLSTLTSAYWPMNEYSNDTCHDISDNLLHGTYHGTYICAEWPYGYGRGFNGASDYVDVPDADPLDLTEEITIGFWLRPDSLSKINTIISKRIPDSTINYQIDASLNPTNQNVRLDFIVENETYRFRAEAPIADNELHYVAVTYRFDDPGSALWMVDGQIVWAQWPDGISPPPTPQANNYPLQIGRSLSGTNPQWAGACIDELQILSVYLEPQYLVQLYYLPM